MPDARIHLKHGDWEIELAGEAAFVERQLDRLLPILGSPAVPPPGDVPGSPATSGEAPVIRVRKQISLEDFFALKEPETDLDRFLVCAYYLEKYEARPCYDLGEAERIYRAAYPEGPWDSGAAEAALERGYLVSEASGYTLTYSGQAYVQNGLI